jgi:cytochrome c biogenesis protein CcdA/peroxiredoxin
VLASFAALAATLLALRAGGESLGWGFQLQSPLVVAALAYLMLLVGLNLSGVFEVGGRLMGLGQASGGRGGLAGTALTGVLTAVVASPWTAPFMGAAVGYALTQPAAQALAVLLALGLGFALPVLVLSAVPGWARRLPRPGPWMERLRRALAFPMYGTAAWLVWVLAQQAGAGRLAASLAGLVALALAPLAGGGPRQAASGDAWSAERVAELRRQGRPVLVNFTAAAGRRCTCSIRPGPGCPGSCRSCSPRASSWMPSPTFDSALEPLTGGPTMLLRIASALLTAAFVAACSADAAVTVGEPAPDFAGMDTYGQTQRLSDYRGRVVVLEWTNHECPYVRKHYGAGNMQVQQREARESGAVWLSIVSSAPGKQGYVEAEEANRLTERRSATPSAVILDPEGDIGRLYGARTTPHMYIVDAEGTLVYMGGIDSIPSSDPDDIPKAKQYVRAGLGEVLAGQPVSEPVTRPYGCSVKY